jgi:hypothetical protein
MESHNKFLAFKDHTTGTLDRFILYIDEFKTKKVQLRKGESKEKRFEEFQSREIDVPVLKQTFYGKASDMETLFTAWEQIHRYVERSTGKRYGNEDTFVTVAPMNENREEIFIFGEP